MTQQPPLPQPLAMNLKFFVGWANSFIPCPRGLVSAWAQKRAHPTFVDFKHNYLKNKLVLI